MIFSRASRLSLYVASVILLVPILGLQLQTTGELEAFHNRTLSRWPSGRLFWRRPTEFFNAAQAWLNDRAFPIIQSTYFKNNVVYAVLDTLPQRRVSLGQNGYLFLNGSEDDALDNVLSEVCIETPKKEQNHALDHALSRLALFARQSSYSIDIVLVPTLPVLYGDRLPRSIPASFRRACGALAAGRSPLLDVEAPQPLHFFYPFREMSAHRNDDAFFPRANYHPFGLSLTVERDAYLAAIGQHGRVQETMTLTPHLSELLSNYGIARYPPAYRVDNPSVVEDLEREAGFNRDLSVFSKGESYDSHVFHNDASIDLRTVLILSDSYGDAVASIFAGAFKQVLQARLPEADVAGVLSKIAAAYPFDRLVLLFNEGNLGELITVINAMPPAPVAGSRK